MPNNICGFTHYWNKIPCEVRLCSNVEQFKVMLEKFKIDNIHLTDTGNFWEVSEAVLGKIEGTSYFENKLKHLKYLKDNGLSVRKGVRAVCVGRANCRLRSRNMLQ